MHTYRLGWLLVLMMGLLVQPLRAQVEAPYLYYFDTQTGRYVIERADGTDRRVLAPAPGLHSYSSLMVGPGWSPSGAWLAVMNGSIRDSSYVLPADGGAPYAGVRRSQYSQMMWSPTADLLFVADADLPYSTTERHVKARFTLVDMSTQRVIVEYTQLLSKNTIIYESWNRQVVWNAAWAPDGSALVYYRPYPRADGTDALDVYRVVLRANGEWSEELTYRPRYAPPPPIDWMPNGGIMTYDYAARASVIYDPLTNERTYIPSPFKLDDGFIWNPTYTHATVFEITSSGFTFPARYRLWLYSRAANSWRLVADDANPIRCFMERNSYQTFDGTCWSTDGTHFAYRRDDTIDLASVSGANVSTPAITFLFWDTQAAQPRFLYTNSSINARLIHYFWFDVNAQQTKYVFSQRRFPSDFDFQLSPSRRYASFFPNHPQHYGRVMRDLWTGTTLRLPPVPEANLLTSAVNWHPNETWLLTGDADCSGSDCGYGSRNRVGVATVEGDDYRQLTHCLQFDPCVGWLPERVIPHLAPVAP